MNIVCYWLLWGRDSSRVEPRPCAWVLAYRCSCNWLLYWVESRVVLVCCLWVQECCWLWSHCDCVCLLCSLLLFGVVDYVVLSLEKGSTDSEAVGTGTFSNMEEQWAWDAHTEGTELAMRGAHRKKTQILPWTWSKRGNRSCRGRCSEKGENRACLVSAQKEEAAHAICMMDAIELTVTRRRQREIKVNLWGK